MKMRVWSAVCLFLSAGTASAVPISYEYLNGTLTTSLSVWSAFTSAGIFPQVATKLYDFTPGVGADFTVAVPRQFTDKRTPWTAHIPVGPVPDFFNTSANPANPSDLNAYQPLRIPGSRAGFAIDNVYEACTPQPYNPIHFATFFMVMRGTCSFVDKIESIASLAGTGVFIINNTPGTGAQLMALTAPTTDIPAIMLSYDQGKYLIDLLSTGFNSVFATSTSPGGQFPFVQFSASWVPHTSVPEPGTLSLFCAVAISLAAYWGLRRRRHTGRIYPQSLPRKRSGRNVALVASRVAKPIEIKIPPVQSLIAQSETFNGQLSPTKLPPNKSTAFSRVGPSGAPRSELTMKSEWELVWGIATKLKLARLPSD